MKATILLIISLFSILQVNAQVSRTVELTAGNLATELTTDELNTVTDLILTGTIDARDFKTMRDDMPVLANLDLSEAVITPYSGTMGTGGDYERNYPGNIIPFFAFYDPNSETGHLSLTTITLPLTATAIDEGAFIRCSNLTTVIISLSITVIEDTAFAECEKLTGLNLHAGIARIGMGAFWGCGVVTVEENNPNYAAQEDILFNKDLDSLIHYPVQRSGSFTVPTTVTALGDGAFWNCKSLQSVILPGSLTRIGSMAFNGCGAMTSITVNSPYPLDLSDVYNVFAGLNTFNCILQVPYNTRAYYAAADQWNAFTNIVEASNGFILSSYYLTINAEGQSNSTLNVLSNVEWTASSDQPWVSVSPSTGTGSQAMTFTAEANPAELSRSAKITFSSDGFDSQTLTVTQDGLPQTIVITPGRLSEALTASELFGISILTLTGSMDARDFRLLRDSMPNLRELDIANVQIVAYSGMEGTSSSYYETYDAFTLPLYAFSNPMTRRGKRGLTKVVLPQSLRVIESYAFSDCDDLNSLILPSMLSNIKYNAFNDCDGLASIIIPASVIEVDWQAFLGCSALLQVEPGNIYYSSIDGVLFNKDRTILIHCPTSKTGEYRIPSTVSTVGSNAFMYASNLTTLFFPTSVITLDYVSFYRCSALFSVDANNPAFSSQDGILFNKDKTLLVKYPESKTGSLVIPSSVNTIGSRAFQGCKELTSLTIPSSVTLIGDGAFEGCTSLTSIHMESPHPVAFTSQYGAFEGVNTSFCILHVPYHAQRYYLAAPQWNAFKNIEEAPEGFIVNTSRLILSAEGGQNLSVNLSTNVPWTSTSDQLWLMVNPASGDVDTMLAIAFEPNTSVTLRTATLTFSAAGYPSQAISIYQDGATKTVDVTAGRLMYALSASELNGITNLTITGTIDARDFKTMRDKLPALAVLDLSDASIEAYQGFEGTVDYQSEYLQNEVPSFAFCKIDTYEGKSSLRNVLLPPDLNSIGFSAFRGCTGLNSITIPAHVTILKDEAFSYCSALQSIFVNAPSPIDLSSSFNVFNNVDKNKCILNVPFNSRELYADADQWREFIHIVEDADGFRLSTTTLNLEAGEGSSGNITLTANKSWTLSANEPWLTVTPTAGTNNQILTITATANSLVTRRAATVTVSAAGEDSQTITVNQKGLPMTIDVTAGNLMNALTANERANINHLIVTGAIDARDFKTMRDVMPLLEVVDLSGATVMAYTGTEGTSTITHEPYQYPANGVPDLAFYNTDLGIGKTSLTTVVLPTTITSIGLSSFSNCSRLSSINLPSSVYSISEFAFYNCKSLKSVELPSSLTSVKTGTFLECSALTEVSIPPLVISIGNLAFSGCNNLTSITLPSLVTSIGDESFSNCYNLTSLSLSDSLTSIGVRAFGNCNGLRSLEIPPLVTSIGESAFTYCQNLASVTLPPLLTSIKAYTFSNCSSLTSIDIPSLVTSIEMGAFEGCMNLASVNLPPSLYSIGENAFAGCINLSSIAIPSTVAAIGANAFYYCTGLSTIYAYRSIPVDLTNSTGVFSLVDTTSCTLRIGYKSRERYAAADQWKDFKNILEDTEGITIDTLTLYFATEGGSKIVNAMANVAWTISSVQTWLTVNPSSGTGDQVLSFTAEANTTAITRKALVTVSATGYPSQTVTITQQGMPQTIEATAGGLKSIFTTEELNGITHLTVTGIIDARDFKTMRDEMPLLANLDLSGARIAAYTGIEGTVGYDYNYSANQVPREAFYTNENWNGKANLIHLVLPSSITSIGSYAFNALTGLTTLTIPSSVTSIEGGAFAGCSNLTSLYANPSVPIDLTFSSFVFDGINLSNCTLYVPSSSVELYKAALQWQDFYSIVGGPVGINDGMKIVAQIKCYPNPFSQKLTIELLNSTHEPLTVDIYNSNGQRVKNLTNGNRTEKVTLHWDGANERGQQVPRGMYLLKVNEQVSKVVRR